jgi:hypothetical protein
LNRNVFLTRVSVAIFGFVVAQVLLHMNGWGMVKTYPQVIFTEQGIWVAVGLIISSIVYLLYWGCERIQRTREDYVDKSLIRYLAIGFVDCLIATLPYISYVATLYLLDILHHW